MPDFGFVGPAYEAANPVQDTQKLINWFVEISQNKTSKEPTALLGAPGLAKINTSYNGEFRGGWVLPGGVTAICVIGNKALLLTNASTSSITATQIGTLLTNSGQVKIRDNGASNIVVIVDGTNLYVYNKITGSFTRSTDGAWLGSKVVAEIDGWFVFAQSGTQKFYSSPNYWNGTAPIDATYYALKDNFSDNLVTLIEHKRELWLFGEETIEVWYNAGNPNFPFSRLPGVTIQHGCAAPYSLARAGEHLIWLEKSERGGTMVVMSNGYYVEPISTPAISYQLNQYSTVSDARAYVYQEEGHIFYVLNLPTADVTWVFDVMTGLWHQRASFDPLTGNIHRQRVNETIYLNNLVIGGDYTNGQIYWQSRSLYVDGDYPLLALRRAPHVWDGNDRRWMIHSRLQVEFVPGVGLSSGADPQAVLRWSNNAGFTWGNEHWQSIGKQGEYSNRCIWRRLGKARDRVYEVSITDPVRRDVVGASLVAFPVMSS